MTNIVFYLLFDYCEANDKDFPIIYNAQLNYNYLKFLEYYAHI